jgi:type IX secretion system PorP/SprF family membrane protein
MKKLNKKYAFALVGLLFTNLLIAQGGPVFRQNQFNALLVNPAQAGANDFSDISTFANTLFSGIEGSPKSFVASGNFNIEGNLGLGVSVTADQLGPVKTLQNGLNVAYHLKLNRQWRLAVGLKGNLSSTTVDLQSLISTQESDPHLQQRLNTGLNLKAGYGLLLYSEQAYFGFSQPNIGKTSFLNGNATQFVENDYALNGYAGVSVPFSRSMDFRPNVIFQYYSNSPINLDLNAIFTYEKQFDFGVSYQHQSGIGAILAMEFKKKLYIGYGFTYPTNQLQRASFQSHEIALRLRLKNKSKGFQSPRFFN